MSLAGRNSRQQAEAWRQKMRNSRIAHFRPGDTTVMVTLSPYCRRHELSLDGEFIKRPPRPPQAFSENRDPWVRLRKRWAELHDPSSSAYDNLTWLSGDEFEGDVLHWAREACLRDMRQQELRDLLPECDVFWTKNCHKMTPVERLR